ncbi:hypothetical protein ACFPN1_14300 [Lysobacter yangpyeongensis]|jgi:hypothetical protein|uniref:Uncharacterized protein n=1 Tax=Lysobacter yangpyeongensis TaxID=346182 RepID=A0ABW0SQ32_9GAMM
MLKRIESTLLPYACPVAGRTVHILRTRRIAADGSTCSHSRCDQQDQCIYAQRIGPGYAP